MMLGTKRTITTTGTTTSEDSIGHYLNICNILTALQAASPLTLALHLPLFLFSPGAETTL